MSFVYREWEFLNVDLEIVLLIPEIILAPPTARALLFKKLQLVIKPLFPLQLRAPPLRAVFPIKLQSERTPLFPDQRTALSPLSSIISCFLFKLGVIIVGFL